MLDPDLAAPWELSVPKLNSDSDPEEDPDEDFDFSEDTEDIPESD